MVATVLPVKNATKISILSKKSFSSFFKVLLLVCQFFCAAPLLNCKHKCLILLHFSWCIFMVTCVVVASVSLEEILAVDMTTIKKILYISEYFSDAALIILTTLTCYYHRDCYTVFPKRFQELERRTQIYQRKIDHQQTIRKTYRRIMKAVFYGMLFFVSTLFLDFVYHTDDMFLFLKSTVVFILPNVTITLWIGQYWALLSLILTRYEVINSILKDLNSSKYQLAPTSNLLLTEVMKGNEKSRWDAPAVLEDLRSIFANLEILLGDVTDVFGVTITANFFSSFLTLSVQFFVLYKMPEKPETCTWSAVFYSLLWISLHCLKFFVILHSNSCLLNVKSETGIILNCFDEADTKTEDAINRFLMQLVVRNNVQMACGIVELDMELVGGIISALSVYVIFLIQIDLGEIILIPQKLSNITATNLPPIS